MNAPAIEKEIQKRFFNLVRGKEVNAKELNSRLGTYHELIEYRFYEVISNAFPILRSKVNESAWDQAIAIFVANKPKSPYIWESPCEFIQLVEKKKLFDFPWLKDLMWFEWMEIKLTMTQENRYLKTGTFDWTKKWNLASSAAIKMLRYPVYQETFEQKGRFPIILYNHQDDNEIYYLEITEFLFRFLSLLHEGENPKNALKLTCKKYKLLQHEVKELLDGALVTFVNNGILIHS